MFPASDHRIQVFCCYQPRQFFIMLSFIITFFDIVPWNDYAFLHSRTVFSYKSFCRQAVLCIVSVIWLSVDQRNPINQSLIITLTTEVSCYLFYSPTGYGLGLVYFFTLDVTSNIVTHEILLPVSTHLIS